jgi:acyl-CoA synthetase (AMP-forming)/AMP-acid ligase II
MSVLNARNQMRRAAGFYADLEAFQHGDRRLTFAEAWTRGLRLANGLREMGLEPQDRVAVLENNSLEAADFFIGTLNANLVRVALHARNSRESHVSVLRKTGTRVVVASPEFAEVVAGLEDEVPGLERVIVRDAEYEPWLAAQSDADPDLPISPDDLIAIRFTGGTTGEPKGAMLTHRAWLASGRDGFYLYSPVEIGDGLLHAGPISHASGNFVIPVWLGGGRNVMLDQFSAEGALDLMEQSRISYMFVVPTMLQAWLHVPGVEQRDWSALKAIHIGGASIAPETVLRAREIFGDVIWNAYGSTEAVTAAMMGPREYFATVEGSEPLSAVGRVHPWAELEIRDDDNQPLPIGEEGEIAIRCEAAMSGYWDNEEATRRTLVDGWVMSGDIGRIDKNGYLYLLDRKGDMIISGGFNIYPTDIENALVAHPAVIEAVAFAVPHERWGETPRAVVVVSPEERGKVTEAELVKLCTDKLGSFKKPSSVDIQTDPLPRTPVGKISRRALREPYWAEGSHLGAV